MKSQYDKVKLITLLFFISPFCFSQLYISSNTNFHISRRSSTFYSHFSYISISSDISGDGVLSLSGVDSFQTCNSPIISNLLISNSKVYILGNFTIDHELKLNSSNLYLTSDIIVDSNGLIDSIDSDTISHISSIISSYNKLVQDRLPSNKYPPLFFSCENSIYSINDIENNVILVGKIKPYSSISLQVSAPPP